VPSSSLASLPSPAPSQQRPIVPVLNGTVSLSSSPHGSLSTTGVWDDQSIWGNSSNGISLPSPAAQTQRTDVFPYFADTTVDGYIPMTTSTTNGSGLPSTGLLGDTFDVNSNWNSSSTELPPLGLSPALIRDDSNKFIPFNVDTITNDSSFPPIQEYDFGTSAPVSSPYGGVTVKREPAFPTAMGLGSDGDSVDMEPDVSSVSPDEVDAVSISDSSDAWSTISGPLSPMLSHGPSSATTSPYYTARPAATATTMAMSSLPPRRTSVPRKFKTEKEPRHLAMAKALDTAVAIRPRLEGPYTRGRAAALAPPQAPKELKPVPVARGPHAGLLGGGEMASIGIYTKDDRWRKIERLREKRRARIVVKTSGGQYACRKAFADRRPRVGGRFVKMDDETKKYLAATKPGIDTTPAELPVPAALKAYQAQLAVSHPSSPHSPLSPSQISLAAAAHAASMASPYAPLFGASSAPPMTSYPVDSSWYSYAAAANAGVTGVIPASTQVIPQSAF